MFTVGVTGHLRLPAEQLPDTAQEVKAFLAETKAAHDEARVLSPCAEGADMLCAGLALELGLRLAVPLPMDSAEYRKDFSTSAAEEFGRLLALADEAFTVLPQEPLPPGLVPRGFYYRQAGIYVARHCDILLAVWDGLEHDTVDGAGTWETVKLARQFGKAVHIISVYGYPDGP
ncbi:MAG: hypothetical protein LBS19_16405 [Clostridiales bacterium]|jgi:hypothetical protein|nr:hypothetical protein [Clostridiales bacterium]